MNARIVHCEDALAWLRAQDFASGTSMVASLPDISEFPTHSLGEWKTWFVATARLILEKCPPDGVSVFFQSDIKRDGVWVDKGFLLQQAAAAVGAETLFHKIVCRAPAGTATFGRPGYSHLLAFSKEWRFRDLSQSTTDVLRDNGERTWTRGMGLQTCLAMAKFLKASGANTIVNPFCGEGSVLAAANHLDLDAVGIERSPKRAERARHLKLDTEGENWAVRHSVRNNLCPQT